MHPEEGIRAAFSAFVSEYADRVLPLGRPEAARAAALRARAHRAGRVLNMGDAFIAGTAVAHELAIATKNVRVFDGLDIEVVNPWDAA